MIYGKINAEGRALARDAFGPDKAPVCLDDLPGNGKAEPGLI